MKKFALPLQRYDLKKWLPYVFLATSQLMVAFNVVGSKVVATHMPLLLAVFLRFSFATLIIFSLYLLKGDVKRSHFKLSGKQWLLLMAQGLSAGALFNLFLIMGLQYTSASMAGMIISTLPAVIAMAAVFFLKERLSTYQKIGILLAIFGLLVINQGNNGGLNLASHSQEFIGIMFILLSLIPETSYYLLSKKFPVELPMLVFSGILNGINVVALLPFMLFQPAATFANIDLTSVEILFLTGLASAVFYISWSKGIKHVSAANAGLFTALSPLMTVLIAALTLGEHINIYQGIGMLFVIFSILLSK